MRACACCKREVALGDIVWPLEAENHWFWFTCPECAVEGREPIGWKDEFISFYGGEDVPETIQSVDRFRDVLRSIGRMELLNNVDNVAEVAR
jgi:hypothetical protein